MPASVWVINLVVLGVILEADLGRRKIGWFRVIRPLIAVATIVPLYLTAVPTSGNNLALQGIGVGVGVLLGLACHLFLSVHFDAATKGRKGRAVSRAGFGYVLFWVMIFGARLAFIYGSEHVFSNAVGQFLVTYQLTVAGLTDALIFMALAMALARSVLLGGRGLAVRRHQPARQLQAA
jgi:hypothetical protein